MEWFYNLVGGIFFRRLQDWERRKHARTMTFVVLFSVTLGLALVKVIKMIYNHTR